MTAKNPLVDDRRSVEVGSNGLGRRSRGRRITTLIASLAIVLGATMLTETTLARAAGAASSICKNDGRRACVRIPEGTHSGWSGSEDFVVSNARADNYYYVRFTAVFAPVNTNNVAYLDHFDIDYWVWGNGVACGGSVWLWGYGDSGGGYNKYHQYTNDERQCWSGVGAYGMWNYTHRTVLDVHQWYRGGQSSKNGIGIGMKTNRVNNFAGQIRTDVRSIDFLRP